MHVEFETPAVQYVATRGLRCAHLIYGGDPLPSRSIYRPADVIDMFEALGLAVVRDGRRMLVGPGSCDVERQWRRARPRTRDHHTWWHARAAERIATRLAQDAERKLRNAEARAAAARADGDEGVVYVVL